MKLLDYTMFDDGSAECRTFVLATAWGSSVCEFDTIERMFSPATVRLILENLNSESRYLSVKGEGIACSGETVLEIQWD